jgi:cysteine desulfurase
MHGGGHEHGMRSGTLNVPGIVGMGAAAEISANEMADEAQRLTALRTRLEEGVMERLDYVRLNGHPTERTPNNLNLSFAYVEGESMMMGFKDLAVSSGSACTSRALLASHVLLAMGLPHEIAQSSLLFGLAIQNTADDVDYVLEVMPPIVERLRQMSPLYAKFVKEKKGV